MTIFVSLLLVLPTSLVWGYLFTGVCATAFYQAKLRYQTSFLQSLKDSNGTKV